MGLEEAGALPHGPRPEFKRMDAGQPSHLRKRETENQRGVDLIKVMQPASGRVGT